VAVIPSSTRAVSAAANLARAEKLVDQALASSPLYAVARGTKGDISRARNRCEEAIPQYEMALSVNPNMAWASYSLSACKLMTGSIEEVIPLVERAIRLSPFDGNIAASGMILTFGTHSFSVMPVKSGTQGGLP
jgi:tetratricopeptide (TPR) repeat protein